MPLQTYTQQELPFLMKAVARSCEREFKISFSQFKYFPSTTLRRLHADAPNEAATSCSITPGSDLTVEAARILGQIANLDAPTIEQRQQYLDALLGLYRALPEQPLDLLARSDVLFLGIEREGRILAQELGWLSHDHSGRIHAKRMRVEAGLLVGLSDLPATDGCAEAVIIDGAIASGATLMAVMEALACKRVRIYSAHAATEGIRSLCRFAREREIDLRISVGFVTTGLNRRFYAVADGRKVVGDLGDMISPLFDSTVGRPNDGDRS